MDRLNRLFQGGKQSRAGFLGQLAKVSLITAAAVSGLKLGVAEAVTDCCKCASSNGGFNPNCAGNVPPQYWVYYTQCTCCATGACSDTVCTTYTDGTNFCYSYTKGTAPCPCGPSHSTG